MSRFITAFLFTVLLLNPLSASAMTIIASTSLQVKDIAGALSVEKCLDDKGVSVRISTADGKLLLESEVMGSEDKLFKIADAATGLATHDFDGDGNLEVIASAFYGPKASGLYIFRFDAATGKFAAIKFLNSIDPALSTDYMTSDIGQENGDDMVVNADGSLVALGLIYPSTEGEEAVAGFYTYKLEDGQFKLVDKKPVPAN